MAERVKGVGGKDVVVGWKELAQINLKARQQVQYDIHVHPNVYTIGMAQ